jgi:hypothetical protein
VHVWTLPAAAGLIALGCGLLGRRHGVTVLAVAWAGLGFAGLVASYFATREDVHWQLRTSADRVVGTVAIGSAALSPLLAAEAWRAVKPALLRLVRGLVAHPVASRALRLQRHAGWFEGMR